MKSLIINGASVDLTKLVGDAEMSVDYIVVDDPTQSKQKLKLRFSNFELRDVKIGLQDGKTMTVPKLYVEALIIRGDMMPILDENGMVRLFSIDDAVAPTAVIGGK